jgi:hypothetical protein
MPDIDGPDKVRLQNQLEALPEEAHIKLSTGHNSSPPRAAHFIS